MEYHVTGPFFLVTAMIKLNWMFRNKSQKSVQKKYMYILKTFRRTGYHYYIQQMETLRVKTRLKKDDFYLVFFSFLSNILYWFCSIFKKFEDDLDSKVDNLNSTNDWEPSKETHISSNGWQLVHKLYCPVLSDSVKGSCIKDDPHKFKLQFRRIIRLKSICIKTSTVMFL